MFGKRSMNVRRSTCTSARFVRRSVELTQLEDRRLMSTTIAPAPHRVVHNDPGLEIDERVIQAATTGTTAVAAAGTMSPLTAIPALSSRASASAKIYLDFNGDTSATWGTYRPGTTPAYDTDGDATTFSDTELANIREIFNRVAEKYAPFNIDVTTIDPGTYANKVATHVVIGGSGSWLGSAAGGVAFINAFTNSSSNNAWVFPAM